MTPRVGAVLLAAGGSSRMGTAKQLLPYRQDVSDTTQLMTIDRLWKVESGIAAKVTETSGLLADSEVRELDAVNKQSAKKPTLEDLASTLKSVGNVLSQLIIWLGRDPIGRL